MPVGWRDSRLQRALLHGLTFLSVSVIAMIGRSLRWKVDGLHHLECAKPQAPIMAFWHGGLMAATYFFRGRGIVVMISENFSGEWIARVVSRFGYRTARGSTQTRGPRALRTLGRDMAAGHATGFAVDGPRGPARRVQPGAVWLAKATGNPIVPFHIEAARFWTVASWDRTQIPKPFSSVGVSVGPTITVPADADDEMLEAKRIELERALADAERRARELLH